MPLMNYYYHEGSIDLDANIYFGFLGWFKPNQSSSLNIPHFSLIPS